MLKRQKELPAWLSDPDRRFFEYARPQLERSARRHRLKIEPWFKDVAAWALQFRHPRGGVGQIVVEPRHESVSIFGNWWRDDFAAETRHMAEVVERSFPWQASDITGAVDEVLTVLLAMSEADLVSAHPMPPGTWHGHFTEKSFGSWERTLPKPRR